MSCPRLKLQNRLVSSQPPPFRLSVLFSQGPLKTTQLTAWTSATARIAFRSSGGSARTVQFQDRCWGESSRQTEDHYRVYCHRPIFVRSAGRVPGCFLASHCLLIGRLPPTPTTTHDTQESLEHRVQSLVEFSPAFHRITRLRPLPQVHLSQPNHEEGFIACLTHSPIHSLTHQRRRRHSAHLTPYIVSVTVSHTSLINPGRSHSHATPTQGGAATPLSNPNSKIAHWTQGGSTAFTDTTGAIGLGSHTLR